MNIQKFSKYQYYIPYIVLIISLVSSSLLRWYFTTHISVNFFGLSFTDFANTHSRFLGTSQRIPYINFDLEYPVVLGAFFYLTGLIGASNLSYFFFANSFFMSLFAVISLFLMSKIHKLVSKEEFLKRSLIFWSLSPSIFLFTSYNWDLLAIFFMLLAIYFLLKGKFSVAPIFLSLGAFTKMFPGFLLLPFLIYTYKKKGKFAVARVFLVFTVTSLLINLPLMIHSFSAWSYFFKFSSERGSFGDNIWSVLFVLRDKFNVLSNFNLTGFVSFAGLGLFVVLYLFVNFQYWRSKKDTFLQSCFLCILAFLVTAKTTSAPFNLWVLPFFVLIPVNIWFALISEWANAFVFYAFFQHIYYNDYLGLPISPGHYFRLTYGGVVVREGALIALGANYLSKLGWFTKVQMIKIKVQKNVK